MPSTEEIQKAQNQFLDVIEDNTASEHEKRIARGGMALNVVASSLYNEHKADREKNTCEHKELKGGINSTTQKIDKLCISLFGDEEKEGKFNMIDRKQQQIINQQTEFTAQINLKMNIVVWIGGIMACAVILNLIGKVLDIPNVQALSDQQQQEKQLPTN